MLGLGDFERVRGLRQLRLGDLESLIRLKLRLGFGDFGASLTFLNFILGLGDLWLLTPGLPGLLELALFFGFQFSPGLQTGRILLFLSLSVS